MKRLKIAILAGAIFLISFPCSGGEYIRLLDKDYRIAGYVKGNKVYDKDWKIKYHLKDGKIYDKDWNQSGKITK